MRPMSSGPVRSIAEPLTLEAFQDLATRGVPLVGMLGCEVLTFTAGRCAVRLPYDPAQLRPGGTMSGPAMMALADITLYGVVLSLIGRVELAVTTDLAIRFLRRPPPGDLIGEGSILRLSRRLAVGEVTILPATGGDAVAHATGTYAIPDGPA